MLYALARFQWRDWDDLRVSSPPRLHLAHVVSGAAGGAHAELSLLKGASASRCQSSGSTASSSSDRTESGHILPAWMRGNGCDRGAERPTPGWIQVGFQRRAGEGKRDGDRARADRLRDGGASLLTEAATRQQQRTASTRFMSVSQRTNRASEHGLGGDVSGGAPPRP